MRQGNALVRRVARLPAAAALAACLFAATADSAQETSAPPGGAGDGAMLPLQERALAAMEALRDELQVLASIRDTQAALLAWNRESARIGIAPAALPEETLPGTGAGRLVPAAAGDIRRLIDGEHL